MTAFLLAAALAFTPENASLAYGAAAELVRDCTPRDAGTIRGRLASNKILDLASATGVDVIRDAFVSDTLAGDRPFTNLYVEFQQNPTGAWVVVMSHYDTKPGVACPGANDGASTSGLLVALADVLFKSPGFHGNLMLAWTDAEECVGQYCDKDGFQGSRRLVSYLKGKGRKVQAAICLDMLGDRDLDISLPVNGSKALSQLARLAAAKAGYPDLVKPSAIVVKDDHVAFLDVGFPAVDLIDFNYGPDNGYWHTKQDTMDKISVQSLLKSGRVVVEMLNILL